MRVARTLRRDHGFAGYIHLKTIPEASPWLIEQAGRWADRLSINLELPTEASLAPPGAREERALDQRARWARCDDAHHRGQGREAPASPRPARAPRSSSAPTTPPTPPCSRPAPASTTLQAEARLLLGLQPDPGAERRAALQGAAAPAREPPLPGRLAAALLRLQRRRDRRGRRGRHARPRRRPEARLGAQEPRAFPVDVNTRPARDSCCACPGSAPRPSTGSSPARRHARLRLDDIARLSASPNRAAAVPRHRRPSAPGLDRLDLRARWCGRPSS